MATKRKSVSPPVKDHGTNNKIAVELSRDQLGEAAYIITQVVPQYLKGYDQDFRLETFENKGRRYQVEWGLRPASYVIIRAIEQAAPDKPARTKVAPRAKKAMSRTKKAA